ncbi:MAG: 3-keto-5-aminohexanoate cleavage protein [Steroidobacteraceae bacterium]
MYFTQDSMLPENQEKLIITAAPYGPQWLPSDYPEDIPVSWEEQTQKAVDCYNAGASVLHLHVRDPKTGHGSKNFNEFNAAMERLRKAVPKMVIQVGGSISFAPASENDKAAWLGYDVRHKITEITPKPDQITIIIGSTQMNILPLTTADDIKGTSLEHPAMQAAYQNMVADGTPEFYLEHLKRLRAQKIQPFFQCPYVHTLEEIEHLIRTGVYMGPLNHALVAIGGGGAAARNPFDFMEYVRRSPHGSVMNMESLWRTVAPYAAIAIALGVHVRVGIEDNLWHRKGERMTSVQQIEQVVRLARELGREVASGDDARRILKIGTWYESVEETLTALGLPPNRKGGELGFVVKSTDGKLRAPMQSSDGHAIAGQVQM